MTTKQSVTRYGQLLEDFYADTRMVVFLCGPSPKDLSKPGAQLRKDLEAKLEYEGFEVVLGEDDGLEKLRNQYGEYADEHELYFVAHTCHAIVLIASSPGSLCELGLFSYQITRKSQKKIDFVIILDEEHHGKSSYIIEGPTNAVDDNGGKVFYGDLHNFDARPIIRRLRQRRTQLPDKKRKAL